MLTTQKNNTPDLAIDVAVECPLWTVEIPDIEERATAILQETFTALPLKNLQSAEVSLVLADDDFIQELNKTWRGKDKPTNVLSFPATEKEDLEKQHIHLMLGDIVISFQTLKTEAKEQEKNFTDHFTHLLIHGFLHLLGHDHEQEEEANLMESLEISILEKFGIKNPYSP